MLVDGSHPIMPEILSRPPLDSVGPTGALARGQATDGPPGSELEGGDRPPPDDLPPRGTAFDPAERNAYLREAAERLSTALFQVIHQPTTKGRDRSLAALVALIYGPTPFGGVNSLREVAMRYGMTEQNLFQLMRGHRDLLARSAAPEYEI